MSKRLLLIDMASVEGCAVSRLMTTTRNVARYAMITVISPLNIHVVNGNEAAPKNTGIGELRKIIVTAITHPTAITDGHGDISFILNSGSTMTIPNSVAMPRPP